MGNMLPISSGAALDDDAPASQGGFDGHAYIDARARIQAAWERMGRRGRFALTDSIGRPDPTSGARVYLTYWFRPEPNAFDDCVSIGCGTFTECAAAAERYAAGHAIHAIAAE